LAEVPQVSARPLVVLLVLLGEVSRSLRGLAEVLRRREGVKLVDRRCELETGVHGPSVEWYVDAELSSGEALSWRLLLYWKDGEWIIESDVRRVHPLGSDSEVELPSRFALDEDLDAELRSATSQLVETASRLQFI
jgi:hypothetical protein